LVSYEFGTICLRKAGGSLRSARVDLAITEEARVRTWNRLRLRRGAAIEKLCIVDSHDDLLSILDGRAELLLRLPLTKAR